MSWVTNAILCLSIKNGDEVTEAQINAFADKPSICKGQKFVSCDSPSLPRGWYGGSKMLECDIYIAAFNYMDVAGWIAHLRSLPWPQPNQVQLFLREQDDDIFTERLQKNQQGAE